MSHCRDEAQLEKLQIFVIQEHFKDQLVVLFGDAMASISPTSSRKQLFDALEQFNQKIDNLTQYLTHIKRINKHINRSIIILTQLVTETYFVSVRLIIDNNSCTWNPSCISCCTCTTRSTLATRTLSRYGSRWHTQKPPNSTTSSRSLFRMYNTYSNIHRSSTTQASKRIER